MNSKERILNVLRGDPVDYTPMGFWLHFPKSAHHGQAAVDAHIDFFKRSKTDILKVMNENTYPCSHNIHSAIDWRSVPIYKKNAPFIRDQVEIIKRLVDYIDGTAPVIATIHGIVASASHSLLGIPRYDSIGRYAQYYFLRTEPQIMADAYRRIGDTLYIFAQECLNAGADGIYYAALGGESDGFTAEEHAKYIAPIEVEFFQSIKHVPICNILHMCKPHVDLKRYIDYPADIFNWGIIESGTSLPEGQALFEGKPVMGGIDDRSAALLSGDLQQLSSEIKAILTNMQGYPFILGSDCTFPTDLPYERIAAMNSVCRDYASVGKEGEK